MLSKKDFYARAINLVNEHGSVIIYYIDSYGYKRRRKIKKNGDCFLSLYNRIDEDWYEFVLSCFILDIRPMNRTLLSTIDRLIDHDKFKFKPYAIEYGKGKSKTYTEITFRTRMFKSRWL